MRSLRYIVKFSGEFTVHSICFNKGFGSFSLRSVRNISLTFAENTSSATDVPEKTNFDVEQSLFSMSIKIKC